MSRKLAPGLYEELVTADLARALAAAIDEDGLTPSTAPLEASTSHQVLARHLRRVLEWALRTFPEEARLERQLRLVERILEVIEEELAGYLPEDRRERPVTPALLTALIHRAALTHGAAPPRPGIPLADSALLTNAPHEHRVGHEIEREIASADRVDLLCSFVKWSGFVRLRDALREHVSVRRRPLRVLTTTYLGATDRRALDELCALGAQVRVSYDVRATRLHAKAWLFHRESGFSTAYIGSSNLSAAAITDGLEWNVRVSAVENPRVLDKFAKTFESCWADEDFEPYEPARDASRFDRAVARERRPESDDDAPLAALDLHPYRFQQAILERLDVERRVHGRNRNLIVAATGTGKTVVAALDFRRLWTTLDRPSLLFVAHRAEILKQSLALFRIALRDPRFGELLVEGRRPSEQRHVFASIQSLARPGALDALAPDAFDVVIIDEFHHAAAPTYDRLLRHLRPKQLLGLTATPERADGQDVTRWFDHRVAAELRLWDAIDRALLVPFQYFGVADDVDLSRITWKRGYDPVQLESVLSGDDARARLILRAVRDHVANPRRMRALGFCVSVAHARFMAERFTAAGIPGLAVTGEDLSDERASAIRQLRDREVNVLFAVDVLNEGVDIPEVDTILMLRPTESATVFLQQLGRGLRRHEDKDCLTVLDFIGKPHERFRFDLRFRALTGATRRALPREIEDGFPLLPSGCTIRLEREAQARVLENVRRALSTAPRHLARELERVLADTRREDIDLGGFLHHAAVELDDVYRGDRSWLELRRAAGLPAPVATPDDAELTRRLESLITFDDPECLKLWLDALRHPSPPSDFAGDERTRRRWLMLAATFDRDAPTDLARALQRLWTPALRAELQALFEVLLARIEHEPRPLELPGASGAAVPLLLHCRYSLVQIMAAFDVVTQQGRILRPQQGVFLERRTRADLLFVTLRKSERDYSPTTMYEDYAISPTELHWQSQNHAVPDRAPGSRHVDPRGAGVTPLLFVRDAAKDARGRTQPYLLLGPAEAARWHGERPINVVWRLATPMPADWFREARVVGG